MKIHLLKRLNEKVWGSSKFFMDLFFILKKLYI